MRTKISVTEEHIRNGVKAHSGKCPVALAVMDSIKPGTMLIVGCDTLGVYCEKNNDSFCFKLGRKAINFIVLFDIEQLVKPFSFYLDIPKRFLK